MKLKALSTLSLVASALSSTTSSAQEAHRLYDKHGVPVFEVRIFGVDDGAYTYDQMGLPVSSAWDLDPVQVGRTLSATQYWAELIEAVPGQNPAIINVGTYEDPGASALSLLAPSDSNPGTKVQAAITNKAPGELHLGAHGYINVGRMNWAAGAYTPSQIVLTPELNMTSVMIHETAHAMGIASNVFFTTPDPSSHKKLMWMPDQLSLWNSHLYDDNHQQARPGQIIYCALCENYTEDPDGIPLTPDQIFDARNDNVYFAGQHVRSVLDGAMPGVPLTLYGGDHLDIPVWSHLELKNSLMSHQRYRNYTNLMEAEVAVLQDLGYQIDRRNFWGYSVYGDHRQLMNDNPFFARNASGTAYLPNTYNTAALGLGLHVYGNHNTIVQRADLLSRGAGGGGVRVDGQGNSLTILPGTRVHANGAYGRGVMFAYGKDHTFTHRGDIEALGERGIAASFDFGHNGAGDADEYRGSYLRTSAHGTPPPLEELNGPLVARADLTGRLAGRYASIYIADNAYVGTINVMGQAQLSGDIISEYNQVDEDNRQRTTALTFGHHADANGRSTGAVDRGFAMHYDGNITGIDNLSLQLAGGVTQLSGNHAVYDVRIAPEATLAGSANFKLNDQGSFANQGTLAPTVIGKSMRVDGTYAQSSSGELHVRFDSQRNLSNLQVDGAAHIDGTIRFTPSRGYYAQDFRMTSDQWLQATSVTGAFATIATNLASPTLTATASQVTDSTYSVAVSRRSEAYSQYGSTNNSRKVGVALDSAAHQASPALHPLYAALDFSSPDGSAVESALPQLSGEVYASTQGALINASGATRAAVWDHLRQAYASHPATASSAAPSTPATMGDPQRAAAWGTGFGAWTDQRSNGNAASITTTTGGFITGVDAAMDDNWRLGVLAGYSHSTYKVKDRSSSAKSDNYTLGAYAGAEWPTHTGALAWRSGLAYTWHDLETDRNVAFADFHDKLSSDTHAGTFQLFGELAYQTSINESLAIEPYANLAFVHLKTNGFTEQGMNGAALTVDGDTMNTTFSTLGARVSTRFELGTITTTARADIGWRHAFGDTVPHAIASFADASSFTVAGSPIGKNTAIVQAGFDLQMSKLSTLGLAYQGQFGSGLTQNAFNASLNVRF